MERLRTSHRLLMAKYRTERWTKWIFRLLFLIGMSFVMLYPIFFMLSNAFKSIEDVYNPMVIWVPEHYSLTAWNMAMEAMNFWKSLSRTLQLLIPCVLFEVVCTTLTAYGFSRFKFRERNFWFGLLLFTIVVPTQTYMIPQYVDFTRFNVFGLLAIPGAMGMGAAQPVQYPVADVYHGGIRDGHSFRTVYLHHAAIFQEPAGGAGGGGADRRLRPGTDSAEGDAAQCDTRSGNG